MDLLHSSSEEQFQDTLCWCRSSCVSFGALSCEASKCTTKQGPLCVGPEEVGFTCKLPRGRLNCIISLNAPITSLVMALIASRTSLSRDGDCPLIEDRSASLEAPDLGLASSLRSRYTASSRSSLKVISSFTSYISLKGVAQKCVLKALNELFYKQSVRFCIQVGASRCQTRELPF